MAETPNYANMVTDEYQNTLHRSADTGGAAFWTDALSRGVITPDQLHNELQKAAISDGELKPTQPINPYTTPQTQQQAPLTGLSGQAQTTSYTPNADLQNIRIQQMQYQMPQYQGIFNPAPSSSAKGSSTKGAAQQAAPVRNSSSMKGA